MGVGTYVGTHEVGLDDGKSDDGTDVGTIVGAMIGTIVGAMIGFLVGRKACAPTDPIPELKTAAHASRIPITFLLVDVKIKTKFGK